VRDSFIPDDGLEDSGDRARFDEHRIAVAADGNRLFDGPRREGRLNPPSVFSARRRRDAHSVTMREELESPCFLGRCHNSVPLRGPIAGSQVDLAAWNRAGEARPNPVQDRREAAAYVGIRNSRPSADRPHRGAR